MYIYIYVYTRSPEGRGSDGDGGVFFCSECEKGDPRAVTPFIHGLANWEELSKRDKKIWWMGDPPLMIHGLLDLLAMHFYDVRWRLLSCLTPQEPELIPPHHPSHPPQTTIGGPNKELVEVNRVDMFFSECCKWVPKYMKKCPKNL